MISHLPPNRIYGILDIKTDVKTADVICGH